MARWLLLGAAVVAAGCYRIPADEACTVRCDFAAKTPTCPSGLACGSDNLCNAGIRCDLLPAIDAPANDAPDAPFGIDGQLCYGTGLVTYCPSSIPATIDLVPDLTTVMINTGDPGAQCTDIITAGGISLCVISADTLSVQGTLRATGSRPLLLFGRNVISVTGLVDVSALGAGTTPSSCAGIAGRNQGVMGNSAGGGAGGSFSGSGGQGGSANDGLNALPDPPSSMISYVRGGCFGGSGGKNYLTTGAGAGGLPGGAVYLLSGGTISIAGSINASGSGGQGGEGFLNASSGGGGGGSGGLIFLDASTITLGGSALLLAEGGGGGGGSTGSQSAGHGASPMLANPSIRPPGGAPTGVNSGQGGSGAGGIERFGVGGDNATGGGGSGGGGGGGAGAIRIRATTVNDSGLEFPPSQ